MLEIKEQLQEILSKSKNIAIFINQHRSGDVIGAGLGLLSILSKAGINTELIVENSELGKNFSFLNNFSDMKNEVSRRPEFTVSINTANADLNKVRYEHVDNQLNFVISLNSGWLQENQIKLEQTGYPYDLIFTIGAPDLLSLGQITTEHPNLFYRTPIINIDRDSANENYGEINIINLKAASNAEIIYSLFKNISGFNIDKTAASNLLAGLIAKTKNFKSTSVSPDTLNIAAELIGLGADRELIVNELYRKHTIKLLKLWGFILGKLSSSTDKKLVWSVISEDNYEAAEGSMDNLTSLVDELIVSIPETMITVVFISNSQSTRGILWSIKNIDALELSKNFSPKGSRQLAEFNLPSHIKIETAVKIIETELNNI